MLSNAREPLAMADRLELLALRTLGEAIARDPATAPFDRLSALSRRHLLDPNQFSDEHQHTRPTDRLLLTRTARYLFTPGAAERSFAPSAPPTPHPASSPDSRLWSALLERQSEATILNLLAPAPSASPAPAVLPVESTTLEVWTETELCGLHALWWLAHELRSAQLADRVERSRCWLTENIQPDNATNRPWAVHVFMLAAHQLNDADAALFADQLVHNALMHAANTPNTTPGAPDRLSAWILLDASLALRAHASNP